MEKQNAKEGKKTEFDALKEQLLKLEEDAKKFYEQDNQAAGTRLRKGLQEIKTKSQELRLGVQNTKNAAKGDKSKS